MNKLLIYASVLLVLTVVFSCEETQIDARLVTVDSLLSAKIVFGESIPEQRALEIINSVDQSSLKGKNNQALYAYLLTLAKYRNNIPLTVSDDSTIDIAVEYYSRKNDLRNRVRSYIMKGAVQEDLGDSTIPRAYEWYRRAIDEVDTTDYYLTGYAHLRMAFLYGDNDLIDSAKIITHFKVALDNFLKCKEYARTYYCYHDICEIYGKNNPDSCHYYGNKAVMTAVEYMDSSSIANAYCMMSGVYYNERNFGKALSYAEQAIQYSKDYLSYFFMSIASARNGHIEQAEQYANLLKENNPIHDYDEFTMASLEEALGNYKEAYEHLTNYHNIRMKKNTNSLQRFLMTADANIEKLKLEKKSSDMKLAATIGISSAIMLLFASVLFLIRYRHRKAEQKALMGELKEEKLRSSALDHNNMSLFKRHVALLFNGLEMVDDDKEPIKNQIDRLKKSFLEIADDNFFDELENKVNTEKNNVMKRMRDEITCLDAQEWRIVLLTLCECSVQTISILTRYRNHRYIYQKRSQIAKKIDGAKSFETILAFYLEPQRAEGAIDNA